MRGKKKKIYILDKPQQSGTYVHTQVQALSKLSKGRRGFEQKSVCTYGKKKKKKKKKKKHEEHTWDIGRRRKK